MDDWACLRAFAEQGSHEAFGELVGRYVDLVYSAALRQVRDAHLAEDVTQTTFITLAAKAKRMRRESNLAGWLLVTTRFLALDALKTNARRERREREAAVRKNESDETEPGEWDAIADHLDAALADLNARDREAITLRYFHNKSFAEVAEASGLTVEAARQRVHRATDRMRAFFARRGAAIPLQAIGPMILANAIQKAPPGLAHLACAKAVSATAAGTIAAGALAGKGLGLTMASTSTKIIAGALAVCLISGGAVVAYKAVAPPSPKVVALSGDPRPAVTPPMPMASAGGPIRVMVRGGPGVAVPSLSAASQQAYQLEPGQVLKRVPPPVAPDHTQPQATYVVSGQPNRPPLPAGNGGASIFMFDGKAQWNSNRFPLYTVLSLAESLAELRATDFEGLGDLGSLKLPGDWVVLKGSDPHARMAALEKILNEEFGKHVHFVNRTVPREVLVATGTVTLHSLPKEPFPGMVDLYTTRRTGNALMNGAGDVRGLLGVVSDLLGTKVVSEVPAKQLFWRNFLSPKDVRSAQSRDLLLKNVAEQTGIHFTTETRPVEIWFVEPATTSAIPSALHAGS